MSACQAVLLIYLLAINERAGSFDPTESMDDYIRRKVRRHVTTFWESPAAHCMCCTGGFGEWSGRVGVYCKAGERRIGIFSS
jgi:hypothetical protein